MYQWNKILTGSVARLLTTLGRDCWQNWGSINNRIIALQNINKSVHAGVPSARASRLYFHRIWHRRAACGSATDPGTPCNLHSMLSALDMKGEIFPKDNSSCNDGWYFFLFSTEPRFLPFDYKISHSTPLPYWLSIYWWWNSFWETYCNSPFHQNYMHGFRWPVVLVEEEDRLMHQLCCPEIFVRVSTTLARTSISWGTQFCLAEQSRWRDSSPAIGPRCQVCSRPSCGQHQSRGQEWWRWQKQTSKPSSCMFCQQSSFHWGCMWWHSGDLQPRPVSINLDHDPRHNRLWQIFQLKALFNTDGIAVISPNSLRLT